MDPDGDSVSCRRASRRRRPGRFSVGPDEIVYAADRPPLAPTSSPTGGRPFGAEATADPGRHRPGRRRTTPRSPRTTTPSSVPAPRCRSRCSTTTPIPTAIRSGSPTPTSTPRPSVGVAEIDGSAISYTAPERTSQSNRPRSSTSPTTAEAGPVPPPSCSPSVEGRCNRPPVGGRRRHRAPGRRRRAPAPVLANDEDPDQDPLEIVERSRGVTIIARRTGRRVVMPDEAMQFTYAVSDGEATARAAVSSRSSSRRRFAAGGEPRRRVEVEAGGSSPSTYWPTTWPRGRASGPDRGHRRPTRPATRR